MIKNKHVMNKIYFMIKEVFGRCFLGIEFEKRILEKTQKKKKKMRKKDWKETSKP